MCGTYIYLYTHTLEYVYVHVQSRIPDIPFYALVEVPPQPSTNNEDQIYNVIMLKQMFLYMYIVMHSLL